jgi:hypothetical protein
MVPSKTYLEKLATRWSDPSMQKMFGCLFFLILVLAADWLASFGFYQLIVADGGQRVMPFLPEALHIQGGWLFAVWFYGLIIFAVVFAIILATTLVGTLFYFPVVIFKTAYCIFFRLNENVRDILWDNLHSGVISDDLGWINAVVFDKRPLLRALAYLAKIGVINGLKGLFWIIFWPVFVLMKMMNMIGIMPSKAVNGFRAMYFSPYEK